MKKILLISSVAIALSGCISNQTSGTLIGAAAGGLLGNTVNGKFKTAATIAGAAIGGMAGGQVGKTMDKAEEVEDKLPFKN